jgi:uncharacterized Ntn-hydrolase superfamily protein
VGAAASQNVTDPSLGPFLLDLLAEGMSADEAMAVVTIGASYIEFRQLTVVEQRRDRASGQMVKCG